MDVRAGGAVALTCVFGIVATQAPENSDPGAGHAVLPPMEHQGDPGGPAPNAYGEITGRPSCGLGSAASSTL